MNLKWLWIPAACAVVGIGVWTGSGQDPERVVILDVGQGDSTLVQMGGVRILVDCGPKHDGYDAGARRVLPELRRLEVSNLDMVLVTHPDADHIGGAASVLRRFPNALLAMNAEFQASPEVRELLRLTGRKADEIWWLRGRHVMSVGSARIDVIAPPKTDDDNSGSLMMRFASPAGRLVLTGDAPEDSEVQHLGQMDWSCDVLLAGHHGSAGSTSEPWLRTTGPRWLAISCGRQNPYGHPSREVLRRAANAGAEVLRTDQGGTLEFMSVGGRYTPLLKKR